MDTEGAAPIGECFVVVDSEGIGRYKSCGGHLPNTASNTWVAEERLELVDW